MLITSVATDCRCLTGKVYARMAVSNHGKAPIFRPTVAWG